MDAMRRAGTASAAILSGLVLTLGLTHATAPEWGRRVGLDLWNFAEAGERLRMSSEESILLGEETERLRESIEAADHVTTRLIAGELTLASATDSIEPLMRERPGFGPTTAITFPAPTFRMVVARYLIDRVRRALEADPGRVNGLLARLEVEYRVMK